MTRDSDITPLDPRFPMAGREPAYIGDVVLARHATLVAETKRRWAAQDTVAVERYVTPLLTQTQPFAAIEAPVRVPYPDLSPSSLDSWNHLYRGQGTAILAECVCPENGDYRLDCPLHGDVGLGILDQEDQP